MIYIIDFEGLDVIFPLVGFKQFGIGCEYGIEGIFMYTEQYMIKPEDA